MQSADSRVPTGTGGTLLADWSPPHGKRPDPSRRLPGQEEGAAATPSIPSSAARALGPRNSLQQPRKLSGERDRKENTGSWNTSLKIRTNLSYFLTQVSGALLPLPSMGPARFVNSCEVYPVVFVFFPRIKLGKCLFCLLADKLCNPTGQALQLPHSRLASGWAWDPQAPLVTKPW